MATYTSNYGWTKPSGSDNVDISVLNDNLDDQDSTIHDAFLNMAPPFSESSTYAVNDIVLYDTGLYKCHTAVVTPGSWTGSTNWQVYKLSEGGSGGGGTSNYNDLTNKPSINGVTLSGNKTTSDLGIDKTAVGLGNVPNVSTNDQTPTFTEASTRNNIASGEKLSVILGKIAKFFNDLKTVAFSGSYTDLSNQPQINSNTLSGNKTSNDLGIANQSDIAPEFNNTTAYARGDLCYHEGALYEFTSAHAAGAWNSAEVDEKNMAEIAKCILNSGITLTPESGVTFEVVRIYTQNKLVIVQIKVKFSSIPTTETKIATFSGFDVGYGYAVGVVGTTDTEEAGIFILSSNRLFVKLRSGLSTSSTYCMTIMGINLL